MQQLLLSVQMKFLVRSLHFRFHLKRIRSVTAAPDLQLFQQPAELGTLITGYQAEELLQLQLDLLLAHTR
jgi:hypothetical protein